MWLKLHVQCVSSARTAQRRFRVARPFAEVAISILRGQQVGSNGRAGVWYRDPPDRPSAFRRSTWAAYRVWDPGTGTWVTLLELPSQTPQTPLQRP